MKEENKMHQDDYKEYMKSLGGTLVKVYGKKKFYSPDEVKGVHNSIKPGNTDYLHYSLSIFCTKENFLTYKMKNNLDIRYDKIRMASIAIMAGSQLADSNTENIKTAATASDTIISSTLDGLGDLSTRIVPEALNNVPWDELGTVLGDTLSTVGESVGEAAIKVFSAIFDNIQT
jgi:hypothetical protein